MTRPCQRLQHLLSHLQHRSLPHYSSLKRWQPIPRISYGSWLRRNHSDDAGSNLSHFNQLYGSSKEDIELLNKARLHGIVSLEQLFEESNVGHTEKIGSKLVDAQHHRHNLRLWLTLLEVQRTRNGNDGVKAVWRGMKYRGRQVRLTNHDPCADAIWSEFLSVGMQDTNFLRKICEDCFEKNFDRPKLFVEVLGALLHSQNLQSATEYSAYLRKSWFQGPEDVLQLLQSACLSNNRDAMKTFCDILLTLPDMKLYGDIIKYLWEHNKPENAMMMHSFLLSRGDLPPTFNALQPFVSYFAQHGINLNQFLHSLDSVNVSFESQIRRLYSQERSRIAGMSNESLNIVASRTMGISPRKLSDDFIARAFATKTFSFDFVLNSLRLLGLVEVGPLSVRQMILRSTDWSIVRRNLAKLKELEIDTGSSAFVRVVKKISETGPLAFLDVIVKTDQHHEVFEDLPLQRKLLTEFCSRKDWQQANLTLAVLNNGEISIKTKERSSNLMLRSMLKLRDYPGALAVMANMRQHKHKLAPATAKYMLGGLIPKSELISEDDVSEFDTVGFLIGVWQDVLAAGSHIQLTLWREPLKALGRQGRIHELEILIIWVAEWYRRDGIHVIAFDKPLFGKETALERLFDVKFQESLVFLSFLNSTGGSNDTQIQSQSAEPWLWGLKILKRLQDTYRVEINLTRVRHAYSNCLKQLFHKENLSNQIRNRIAQARNRIPLNQFEESFEKLWSEPTSTSASSQSYRINDDYQMSSSA